MSRGREKNRSYQIRSDRFAARSAVMPYISHRKRYVWDRNTSSKNDGVSSEDCSEARDLAAYDASQTMDPEMHCPLEPSDSSDEARFPK
jgi:hypothetical protein